MAAEQVRFGPSWFCLDTVDDNSLAIRRSREVDMWDKTVVIFHGKEVVRYHYREFFIGRIRNSHQKLTTPAFIFDFRIGAY